MTGSAQRMPAGEHRHAEVGDALSGILARAPQPPQPAVIVNADDWGREVFTTDRILECVRAGVVSSASAMVFMQDAERAADLARAHAVDCGLHLNLTLELSAPGCSPGLREHHRKVKRFLESFRFAPAFRHPRLASSFEYVVRAQLDEYERLYGVPPRRVDGHHHMHLCANVIREDLLPAGLIVRRNFSFRSGEKSGLNRAYRGWIDRQLAERYQLTDYFFDLTPLRPPERLKRMFELGARANVEIETHPALYEEYRFLRGGELERYAGSVAVMRGYGLRRFAAGQSNFGARESSKNGSAADEVGLGAAANTGSNA